MGKENDRSRAKVESFLHENEKLLKTSQSFRDIYQLSMARNPDALAILRFDDTGKAEKYTYARYKNLVFATASKLSGVLDGKARPGSVVALKLQNSIWWPVFFWAILMSGHTPLLINAGLPVANANNLITQSHAQAIITNDEHDFCVPSYRVNDIVNQMTDYSFVPDWADHVIFCSSGTTGAAKLAVYNGKNMVAQILASHEMGKETMDIMYPENDLRIFCMLPFHHIFGFVAVLLWYTFYGKTLVFPASNAIGDTLYAARKGKVTHFYSVPLFWDSLATSLTRQMANKGPKYTQILDKMVAFNTRKIDKAEAGRGASKTIKKAIQKKLIGTHIRFCISGGGYLSPKTASLINGIGYPLYNGFGMTEVGVTSVELSPYVEQRLKGSIGKPLYGVSYKIRPLENGDDSSIGELMVKSNITHIREYVGGILVKTKLDPDGYFATGDVASRDALGNYYIRSRLKDTIILANGENVYPDEIEDYFKGIKHVKNICVLGAKPKGEKEEMVCLVIEVDNSAKPEDLPILKSDIKAVNDGLPSEKKIKKVFLCKNPLPISNAMKVRRVTVRESLANGDPTYMDFEKKKKKISFEGYDKKEVQAVQAKVIKAFSKTLLLPEFKIDGDDDWGADLSGDSMSYVEMVQNLEQQFRVKIPTEQFGVLMTANDFTKEILDLQKVEKDAENKGEES